MATTSPQIPTGPYFGFSLQELVQDNWDGKGSECELTRYKNARRISFSRMTGSNVNGQNFQWGSRSDGTLDEWQADLQIAIGYLDQGRFPFPPPQNGAAITFV